MWSKIRSDVEDGSFRRTGSSGNLNDLSFRKSGSASNDMSFKKTGGSSSGDDHMSFKKVGGSSSGGDPLADAKNQVAKILPALTEEEMSEMTYRQLREYELRQMDALVLATQQLGHEDLIDMAKRKQNTARLRLAITPDEPWKVFESKDLRRQASHKKVAKEDGTAAAEEDASRAGAKGKTKKSRDATDGTKAETAPASAESPAAANGDQSATKPAHSKPSSTGFASRAGATKSKLSITTGADQKTAHAQKLATPTGAVSISGSPSAVSRRSLAVASWSVMSAKRRAEEKLMNAAWAKAGRIVRALQRREQAREQARKRMEEMAIDQGPMLVRVRVDMLPPPRDSLAWPLGRNATVSFTFFEYARPLNARHACVPVHTRYSCSHPCRPSPPCAARKGRQSVSRAQRHPRPRNRLRRPRLLEVAQTR